MITIAEIRQLSDKELEGELARSLKELMVIKMNVEENASKESHKIRLLKRHVARIKTIKKENQKK